jgi:HK97 gp10 family phage protein
MRIENWAPAQITAEIEKTAMDRLEQAGEIIADRARALCPVDTGALKKSIRVRRLKGDPKLDVRIYAGNRVEGGSMKKGAARGAFYAHMVEYGTVKMPAKPFLRPALNGSKGQIMSAMEGEGGGASGGWGDVMNWKPDPGRSAFLDAFEAGLRK